MGDVIQLRDAKPHGTGKAVCLQCKHEWVAVAPVGAVSLECPNCETNRGVFKFLYEPKAMYRCSCGNELFWITPEGHMCPNCGIRESF